jgi:hypothetical protein
LAGANTPRPNTPSQVALGDLGTGGQSHEGHMAREAQEAQALGLEGHQDHAKPQNYIGRLMERP